jgi:aminomethyltransferase
VTSGTFSPVLKHGIGMGYVETAYAKLGTEIKLEVRGKQLAAQVAKMPFVPTRYFK